MYSQEVTTVTRNNPSEYQYTDPSTNVKTPFKSGFFQTPTPTNYPGNPNEWWYLIDTRHTDPRYAMQLSGAFGDQNLWFRKIDTAVPNQAWSKIVLQDPYGNIGIDGSSVFEKFLINGSHMTSTMQIHADNGSQPNAYLTLWASEPQSSYTGVGIGNNVRSYYNSKAFTRINPTKGGSYVKMLEDEINFNLISKEGVKKQMVTLANNGVLKLRNYANVGDAGNRIQFGSYGDNDNGPYIRSSLTNAGGTASKMALKIGSYWEGEKNELTIIDGKVGVNTPGVPLKTLSVNEDIFAVGSSSLSFQDGMTLPVTKANVPSLVFDSVNMPYYGFLAPNAGGSAEMWISGNSGIRMFTGGDTKARFMITSYGDAAFQGKVEAKEIKVTQSPTADFVFEENYALPKLKDVEKHIKEKKHLPKLPLQRIWKNTE